MEGMEYGGENDENGRDLDDEEESLRRGSEPSRKRTHIEDSQDANRSIYRQHSSTYPPPFTSRAPRGNMGPPGPHVLPSSSNVTSPGEMSNVNPMGMASNPYHTPTVVLGDGGISHSPKPLSPNQQDQHRLSIAEATSALRNRSPSLTQVHQNHNSRAGQATPPANSQMPQHTQLPSLAGLANAENARLGHSMRLPIQSATHNSMHNMQPQPMHGSNPGSLSSHHSSGGSMREIAGDNLHDVWSYVRNLEQRFSRMQDEYELRISRLQEDLIALKGHHNFQPR